MFLYRYIHQNHYDITLHQLCSICPLLKCSRFKAWPLWAPHYSPVNRFRFHQRVAYSSNPVAHLFTLVQVWLTYTPPTVLHTTWPRGAPLSRSSFEGPQSCEEGLCRDQLCGFPLSGSFAGAWRLVAIQWNAAALLSSPPFCCGFSLEHPSDAAVGMMNLSLKPES